LADVTRGKTYVVELAGKRAVVPAGHSYLARAG
jgi:hypothetical protein